MRAIAILFLTFVLTIGTVSADRGFIPPPNVFVSEDYQAAIVAWDGEKEVLMLATNVRANEQVEIWEVIPLPSKPVVEKGNEKSFERIYYLYGRKVVESRKMVGFFGELATTKQGVEVIFRKQIGAHNLTVVKAESVKELEGWVKENLNLSVPAKAFERYISKGYNYFVFDRICVGPEARTVEPLIYTFETDEAYYPLVITTETTEAPSSVSLFLITKGKPLDSTPLWKSQTVFFSGEELKEVHEKLYEMFPSGAYVTYYRDFGTYSEDFVVRNVYVPTVLDLASEWLNERLFVQVLKQYVTITWSYVPNSTAKVFAVGILIVTFAGLAYYGYGIYYLALRLFKNKVFSALAVATFYVLTVCVDDFGLFVLATSLLVGVGAIVVATSKLHEKLRIVEKRET